MRLKKRKEFEDNIRRNRLNLSNWIKYAQWEESQKEIQRARSIWERALDIDHRFEIKHLFSKSLDEAKVAST